MKKFLLYWLSRILAFIFLIAISLLALDVFNEESSLWQTMLALLIHLIPTYAFLAVLWVAWNREFLGGVLFILLGIVFTFFFHTYQGVISFLLLSVPLFLIGILFILQKKPKRIKYLLRNKK